MYCETSSGKGKSIPPGTLFCCEIWIMNQLTYPPALVFYTLKHKQVHVFVNFLRRTFACFMDFKLKMTQKRLRPCVCARIQLSSVFGRFDVSVPGWSVEMPPCLIWSVTWCWLASPQYSVCPGSMTAKLLVSKGFVNWPWGTSSGWIGLDLS